MLSATELAQLAAAAGAALGLRHLVMRWVDRRKHTIADNGSEVDVIREVLDQLRNENARKDERIDRLEQRVDTLEERERHALTRAAVHEAWDQLAFQALLASNPDHPHPPPLRGGGDNQ